MVDTSASVLRVHAALDDVDNLGPGVAAAVWVQGCLRACRGCMSPDTFDPGGGRMARIEAVAGWLTLTGRSFLTISGGEPFDQADALVDLIDLIRADRDWIVTCYTGHRIEHLEVHPDPAVADLLERLDLLIDGPFVEERFAPLLWRGSTNQRIHDLSGRVAVPDDEPVGLSLRFQGGDFRFIGVPPVPQFLETFVSIAGEDVSVSGAASGLAALPFPTQEEF